MARTPDEEAEALLQRARSMAATDLPPIVARLAAACDADLEDDATVEALAAAANDAYVAGFNFGVIDAAAQMIEQGYDGTRVIATALASRRAEA